MEDSEPVTAAENSGLARDPVCGMAVDRRDARSSVFEGRNFFFCSSYCSDVFRLGPDVFAHTPSPPDAALDPAVRRIAYFSMEVAVDPRLPIYSGGLGVLAGDTLRSFADLKIPVVGVSILYGRGYFDQTIEQPGKQREHPVEWKADEIAALVAPVVHVTIERRSVAVRAWRYDVRGASGYTVPLILLDTDVEENASSDRTITACLYGGDERYRLAQEVVLGVGGIRMLRALGHRGLERFHLNEGHASLLALELLRERQEQTPLAEAIEQVKRQCVFTTHTPVPAGHDRFSYELVHDVLGDFVPLDELRMLAGSEQLNMTFLALNLAHFVNGVAKRHGEVSQHLFPGYAIDAVTNGVHSFAWTCDAFRRRYDRYVPGWARDPFSLRHAVRIPRDEIWSAHGEAKTALLDEIRRTTSQVLAPDCLTIGFARRATAYKRADLVFFDPARLVEIASRVGRLQFVFAGKAHPNDEPGKEMIRRIFAAAKTLGERVPVVYLENYDLALARLLTSGVDLWLNTPLRPLEASGTSGMKAAHNAIPSLSVLDGWWIEGHMEGVTGWSIGGDLDDESLPADEANRADAARLYEKLTDVIVPLYYDDRDGWIDVMRRTIAFNASFFNTHRMVQQYAANAYV